MDEKEILETTGSDNLDGVYTLKVSGAALDAAIEEVSTLRDEVDVLNENFSKEGYVTKEFATVNSAITGINGSIAGINDSLTKISTRLTAVEEAVAEENEFEDRVGSLEGVIYDSENEQGGTNNGLVSRVVDLEGNFKSDGYVTKSFSTLESSISSTNSSVVALTNRVELLEHTKYNSTFSSEVGIGKQIDSSTPATLTISVTSLQGKHILGYKIYYHFVEQSTPSWSKVFIPFDLIDKFTSETKLDSALGFSITKGFSLSSEINQEKEYFSIADFNFYNWHIRSGYNIKIEVLYEHNLSHGVSSYYN